MKEAIRWTDREGLYWDSATDSWRAPNDALKPPMRFRQLQLEMEHRRTRNITKLIPVLVEETPALDIFGNGAINVYWFRPSEVEFLHRAGVRMFGQTRPAKLSDAVRVLVQPQEPAVGLRQEQKKSFHPRPKSLRRVPKDVPCAPSPEMNLAE